MKRIFALITAVLAALSCSINQMDALDEFELLPGDKLPEATVTLADGTVVNETDLIGKIGVICLFDINCHINQIVLDDVQQVYDIYKGKENVSLFCVSSGNDSEAAKEFWRQNGYTMPCSFSTGNEVTRSFGSDRKSVVIFSHPDNTIATKCNEDVYFDNVFMASVIDKLLEIDFRTEY